MFSQRVTNLLIPGIFFITNTIPKERIVTIKITDKLLSECTGLIK